MSFENPTRLRIGMHGNFAGKDFRLIGRVVMGVEVDGETYYWNEFNLQTGAGDEATLVYEETEAGGTWRLFTMFEPEYPMTAADAALKQVGDPLNLTGEDVRVTLVDSSRVYRIEGSPPEGVEVGDVAHYFNAEQRDTMLVVSWTGEEVEFYQGNLLSTQAVSTAFGLTGTHPAAKRLPVAFNRHARLFSKDDSTDYSSALKFGVQTVGIIAMFLIIFGRGFTSCSFTREALPVKRISAAPQLFVIGTDGRWKENKFRIMTHALVEIAEPAAIYDRHEYLLADNFGQPWLLVCGDATDANNWTLYTPLSPLLPQTPQQAAAIKYGDTVNIDGVAATITDLFQSTVRSMDALETNGVHLDDVTFGYRGRSEFNSLLVRWNNSSIHFYWGKKVSSQEFAAAFSASIGK